MYVHLTSTTSTMDEAAKRVREGDTTTFAVSADEQTSGRGRQGRPWQTFPGHSLAVTYILRPAQGPHLPLIAALALHQALASMGLRGAGYDLKIKWPNDILLNGKKLAGILCENLGTRASLVGMGVNLTRPESIPPEFTGTFLSEAFAPQAPLVVYGSSLLGAIGTCLKQHIDLYEVQGWGALHNNYLSHCSTIGNKVRWNTADKQELTGTARSLTKGGQLEMVAEDGTVHVIHSGEIIEYKQ